METLAGTMGQPHSNFCFRKSLNTEKNHSKRSEEATSQPGAASRSGHLPVPLVLATPGSFRADFNSHPKTLDFLLSSMKLKLWEHEHI